MILVMPVMSVKHRHRLSIIRLLPTYKLPRMPCEVCEIRIGMPKYLTISILFMENKEKKEGKVTIDGHLFDTGEARSWNVKYLDGKDGTWKYIDGNEGTIYLSPTGVWYVHRRKPFDDWMIYGEGSDGARQVYQEFSYFLSPEDRKEISGIPGMEFEVRDQYYINPSMLRPFPLKDKPKGVDPLEAEDE